MNRRDFFRDATAATLLMLAGGEEIHAQAANSPKQNDDKPVGPPVPLGVIGVGAHGRDILATLARLPGAPVAAICDNYPAYLKRGQEIAPKATAYDDYKKLLDDKNVQGVIIATPSHLHTEITLAAIQAGKHVYLEAPMASNIAEAKEIAQAGAASKQIFQVGQQYRANGQHHHVLKFVRTGALNKICGGRMQWHKKTSWRRASPNAQREQTLNWRLRRATSGGLLGEVGVHQLDVASWFLGATPVSVLGFGGILAWPDGRDVYDTVQCVVEYPKGVRVFYDATLASSFEGAYELLLGTDSAMLLREQRAWMFKETDSPLLGWEVYARHEKIGDETGIALVANATKLLAKGIEPGKTQIDLTQTALYFALQQFADCVRTKGKPDCGAKEGYQAAAVALTANEAVQNGTKIEFKPEMFQI